jgi:hypothetical protein
LPSLFETRRRLPTSATKHDVRATKPELFDPRRDGGLDLLPFLERATPLPRESSDTRRAALRPFATTPVSVPPTLVGLPNRDIVSTAPPPRPKPKCIARIDVHESADREGRVPWSPARMCLRWVHALCGACRRRSPPRRPPDIRCRRRACLQRRMPLHADGPTETLVPATPREERRLPEDQDAFHRHDTRRNLSRRVLTPSGLRAGSLAHAAHTHRYARRVFLEGHCKVTVRSPALP